MPIASCRLGHDTFRRALYSPKEVQEILGISHATLYRLLAARRLDGRKLNGKTVITAASVEQLVAELPKIGEGNRFVADSPKKSVQSRLSAPMHSTSEKDVA